MFKDILNFFKKNNKKDKTNGTSKDTAKERLHLVLMQDRANVSADFLDLMRREIIEVIKKYIDIDEELMDVRLENKENPDGTQGAPALYANIPIINIKEETRKLTEKKEESERPKEAKQEKEVEVKENKNEKKKEVTKTTETKEEIKIDASKENEAENNSEKESKNE